MFLPSPPILLRITPYMCVCVWSCWCNIPPFPDLHLIILGFLFYFLFFFLFLSLSNQRFIWFKKKGDSNLRWLGQLNRIQLRSNHWSQIEKHKYNMHQFFFKKKFFWYIKYIILCEVPHLCQVVCYNIFPSEMLHPPFSHETNLPTPIIQILHCCPYLNSIIQIDFTASLSLFMLLLLLQLSHRCFWPLETFTCGLGHLILRHY